MNPFSAIVIGLKEIWAHKFRSMLTMLGIVLGVSSLVAMSAMVKGMENGMTEALVAIGGLEKIVVQEQEIPLHQRHLADQAVGCTMEDVLALQKGSHLIEIINPEMRAASRGAYLSRAGKFYYAFNFVGTWPNAIEMNQHVIEHGRMFNEIDDEQARQVCVIGTATRDALFGAPEEIGEEIIPIGEMIQINSVPFRIIGMFKHYEGEQDRKRRLLAMNQPKDTNGVSRSKGYGRRGGGGAFWYKNNTVYTPLNTVRTVFRMGSGTNSAPDPRMSALNLKIKDISMMESSLQQTRNILMMTHRGIEDFTFQTQEDWSENITTTIRNARMSGSIIAGISLLVGGIGIMNIMLASITERIREIGIRKAIGATPIDIFVMIIVESVVIAMLGGILGLLTSATLVQGMASISPTGNEPQMTMQSMWVAFGFSVGVGMLAGLIPAIKAASLDPIQALRYE